MCVIGTQLRAKLVLEERNTLNSESESWNLDRQRSNNRSAQFASPYYPIIHELEGMTLSETVGREMGQVVGWCLRLPLSQPYLFEKENLLALEE